MPNVIEQVSVLWYLLQDLCSLYDHRFLHSGFCQV